MKLKLVLDDRDLIGAVLPKWYGIAYREYERRRTILYLIPFNLFVRYAMRLYWRFYKWIKHDEWQGVLNVIYSRGYNDGNTSRYKHYDRLARIMKGEDV